MFRPDQKQLKLEKGNQIAYGKKSKRRAQINKIQS
jgi:hypothetical protein